MKRIATWQFALAGACTALAATTLAAAQEERDDVFKVYREMRTMARVLGEVLDRNELLEGPQGLIGASPFDAQVESSYTPTVGVTFNVSVRFPIEEPETPPEAPAVEPIDPNEDLWERFSHSRDRNRDDEPNHDQDANRDQDADREVRPGSPRSGERGPGPDGARWGEPYVRWESQTFDHILRIVQESYDPAKVEKLQNVVVETLAKYGHKFEHVPADERIVIVIDAPKTRSKFYRRADEMSSRMIGNLSAGPRGGDVHVIEPYAVREPMVVGLTDFGDMPWLRDHMLISVSRGDLTDGVTPEDLASKIRNLRY